MALPFWSALASSVRPRRQGSPRPVRARRAAHQLRRHFVPSPPNLRHPFPSQDHSMNRLVSRLRPTRRGLSSNRSEKTAVSRETVLIQTSH